MMREYKTTSLADQVFERLENDIIQGVYQKGEILTELKLVELMGVSRTPIREALRRLEQERLIVDSGKGSIVVGITEDDLVDIMNIRQRIEGLASYYATLNRKTRRYRRIALEDKSRTAHTMKEHREIYDAIMAGDAELAMELTARHIENAKDHMIGRMYHG